MVECFCTRWAGYWGKFYCEKLICTKHHPTCPHYNDSLITVWKVTVGTSYVFCGSVLAAGEYAGDFWDGIAVVTEEKMHKEVFDQLPEFQGF